MRRVSSIARRTAFRWFTIAPNWWNYHHRVSRRFRLVCVRTSQKEVKAAVERLPAKHKQVVVLHNFQELSVQQTAQELHATIPAVKTQLFRARAALSKSLLRESAGLRSQRTFARKRHGCSPELAA